MLCRGGWSPTGVKSFASNTVGGNPSSSFAFLHSSKATAALPGVSEKTAPSLSTQNPAMSWRAWVGNYVPHRWVGLPSQKLQLILSQGCAYQPFSAQESVICRTTLQQPNPGRPRSPSPDVGPHGSTRQPQAETVHGPVQREVFLPSRCRCPLTQQDLSKTGSSSCHFDKLQGRGSLLLVSPVSQGNGETLKARIRVVPMLRPVQTPSVFSFRSLYSRA